MKWISVLMIIGLIVGCESDSPHLENLERNTGLKFKYQKFLLGYNYEGAKDFEATWVYKLDYKSGKEFIQNAMELSSLNNDKGNWKINDEVVFYYPTIKEKDSGSFYRINYLPKSKILVIVHLSI